MKHFSKIIIAVLTLALIFSALPFSAAATDKDVESIVSEDYQNYLDSNTGNTDDLVAGTDYVAGEILFNVVSDKKNLTNEIQSLSDKYDLKVLEVIDETALKSTVSTSSVSSDTRSLCRASFDSDKMSVFELCKALNSLDNIKDCEPNYIYTSCDTDTFTMPSEISSSSDYSSNEKWYFDNMNITDTWQQYSTLGAGETVCVIDNGLNYNHEEIKDRLWDDGNGNHGYNAEFNNNDIYGKLEGGPCHGSHCSGIIAMQGGNGGLVGVAPEAKIMMCNAVTSSTGYFTNANLIKSLEYAVQHGADIISMSLGGYTFGINFERAVACASFSALICCAAGNDGLNTTARLHFPSASTAVIGVMALGSGTSALTLSSYSNYDLTGRYYQVAVPGTDIYAIDGTKDSGYVSMTGTSMATPFMAGICALYASKHQNMSATELRRSITDASGELVKGYKADAKTNSFKRVTPQTLLSYSCAAAENVTISDKTIDEKVRTALNVSDSYQLTNYDLESVSYLDLSGMDFRNFEALKQLTKLTYINCSSMKLTDADAAEMIKNLSDTVLVMDFSDNQLTNLDFLNNYNGFICRLNAAENNIDDISALSKFTMTSDLDISRNKIVDISPIKSMTGLLYFYAPGNLIEDPSPIVGLTKLEEAYFGNYNPNLADMFVETYFSSGTDGNRISTLEPLTDISTSSRLHYLNLSYNYIHNDPQYSLHASKIENTMATIGSSGGYTMNQFSNFTYKLVVSPDADGQLTDATDFSLSDKFISRSDNSFSLSAQFNPQNANHYTNLTWSQGNGEKIIDKSGNVSFNSTDISSVSTFIIYAEPSALSGMSKKSMKLIVTAPEAYSAIAQNDGTIIVKTNICTEKIKYNGTEYTDYTDNPDELFVRTWVINQADNTAEKIYPGDSCGYSDVSAISLGTDKNAGKMKILSASKLDSDSAVYGEETMVSLTTSLSTDGIVIYDSQGNRIDSDAVLTSSGTDSANWVVRFTWNDATSANSKIKICAARGDAINTTEEYSANLEYNVTIPAQDIQFKNDTNTVSICLGVSSYTINYSFLPAAANSGNSVKFSVKDSTIAYVSTSGVIYPRKAGSTTVNLTLPNGKVKSFFVTVKNTYVQSAEIFNPSTVYTAGKQYSAIVYTKKTSSLKLCTGDSKELGIFSSSEYSTTLYDENGTLYQRWIVPFTIDDAGEYTVSAYAYDSSASAYNTSAIGSFPISVNALTAYDAYGSFSSYNSKFDTKISIYKSTGEFVQSVLISGISAQSSQVSSTDYKFTNIPNGTYNVKIERDGCKTSYIAGIVVNGNTEIKEENAKDTIVYSLEKSSGDINGDDSINIDDISALLLCVNFACSAETAQNPLSDINGDGIVDISDISIVLGNL